MFPWHPPEHTLAGTAEAFLARPGLARSTRRSYDQTLTGLVRELGSDQPLSTVTVEVITVVVTTAWGGRAPATWNRQVTTVRSFLGFCQRRRWLVEDLTVDLERRAEPADRTKVIPLSELERLWRREEVGVREKALWRLLYETAARASEALSINVEDLELETSACGSAPRAATPTGCTSRPAQPGCCRGSSGGRTVGRCSWPTGVRSPPGRRQPSIAVRRPVGVG